MTPRASSGWTRRGLRLIERLLARLYGAGWAASVARRIGLQPDPLLRTNEFRLPSRRTSAPTLRVAIATDFHAGSTTHPEVLRRACVTLAGAHPDVLLLAGDFVERNARHIDQLVPMLESIPAPLGRFAVLGNHDLVAGREYIAQRLLDAGIEVLTNRAVQLPPPHQDVWLCGLDDPTRGDARADDALDGVPDTRIVLMHSPDGMLAIGERPFDLALCGHTHGGQIALPGGWPLVLPEGRLNRRFLRGIFRLGRNEERALMVSCGVGCSTVPVRLFARAEVHLCTFVGDCAVDENTVHAGSRLAE